MKYDDASWHYGGDFPSDLPNEAGATHIGMFVAWALLNGLPGEVHTDEFPEDLKRLKSREITPGQFLITACDEKFTDEDLNDEGNAFTQAYFDLQTGKYLTDYESILGANVPSLYYVPDTWESFDKLSPIIKERFLQWKSGELETSDLPSSGASTEDKPWWKFW